MVGSFGEVKTACMALPRRPAINLNGLGESRLSEEMGVS